MIARAADRAADRVAAGSPTAAEVWRCGACDASDADTCVGPASCREITNNKRRVRHEPEEALVPAYPGKAATPATPPHGDPAPRVLSLFDWPDEEGAA